MRVATAMCGSWPEAGYDRACRWLLANSASAAGAGAPHRLRRRHAAHGVSEQDERQRSFPAEECSCRAHCAGVGLQRLPIERR